MRNNVFLLSYSDIAVIMVEVDEEAEHLLQFVKTFQALVVLLRNIPSNEAHVGLRHWSGIRHWSSESDSLTEPLLSASLLRSHCSK